MINSVYKRKTFNGEFYLFVFSSLLILFTSLYGIQLKLCSFLPYFVELLVILLCLYYFFELNKTYKYFINIAKKRYYLIGNLIFIILNYILLIIFKLNNINNLYLLYLIPLNFIYYLFKLIYFISGFITSKKEILSLDYTYFIKYLVVKEESDSSFINYHKTNKALDFIGFAGILYIFIILMSFYFKFSIIIYSIFTLLLLLFVIYYFVSLYKNKVVLILFIYELISILLITIYFISFYLKADNFSGLDLYESIPFIIFSGLFHFFNLLMSMLVDIQISDINKTIKKNSSN